MAGKLGYFLESNILFPLQFLSRRGLETCDNMLTLSHHLQVALGTEKRLVQLDFSPALYRVSHRSLLYKLIL